MTNKEHDLDCIVAFTIDGQRFALPLPSVLRVIPVVEITPLPNAPAVIMGMVNIHGTVIPVADMRKRMGMAPRGQLLGDKFIIVKTPARTLALTADEVEPPQEIEPPQEAAGAAQGRGRFIAAGEVAPGLKHIKGVAALTDGLTLIHDIDGFLSIEEEQTLDNAIKQTGNQGD
ncbi:MAG: purine-binding chemotaxis protein CheW [Deltaproteobacteria bacterium]|nr:purine-binding chemotaxis protein CheW [Deltaproteobacteria bacterium]